MCVRQTLTLFRQCSYKVQVRMAELCTHLFIDEAHHAAAPTWHAFKSVFKAETRHVLQFTATPFRVDGAPLDGEIVYVYPMRQAQREGYFRFLSENCHIPLKVYCGYTGLVCWY